MFKKKFVNYLILTMMLFSVVFQYYPLSNTVVALPYCIGLVKDDDFRDGVDSDNFSYPSAMVVRNNTAYVVSYLDDAIVLVNITDPFNLVEFSNNSNSTCLNAAHDIEVSPDGKYAYVVTFSPSVNLTMWNVTDKTNIVLVNQTTLGEAGMYMFLDGDFLHVSSQTYNYIYNVTDKANFQLDLVKKFNNGIPATSIIWHQYVISDILYVFIVNQTSTVPGDGVLIYNISNLSSPVFVNRLNDTKLIREFHEYYWNGFHYLLGGIQEKTGSYWRGGIGVWNISASNLTHPSFMYRYDTLWANGSFSCDVFDMADGYAFFMIKNINNTALMSGVSCWNFTDINNPSYVGCVTGKASPNYLNLCHEIEFNKNNNYTYLFVLAQSDHALVSIYLNWIVNAPPINSNPAPSDGATNVNLNPYLNITVNDPEGDMMNITKRTNASGSWVSVFWLNNTGNTTMSNSTSGIFTSYNTKYWWSVNNTDGMGNWNNDTYSFTTKLDPNMPVVTSNSTTGVGTTNVTFHGYLVSNGSLATTCGFRYGTTSGSYSANFSKGIYNSGTEFSNANISLTPGQIYYYQAWANNTAGFSSGTELAFLTKPNDPFNANMSVINPTYIRLNWTKGTGANNTVVVEKTTGIPSSPSDGTIIYNNTGIYVDVAITSVKYYKAWSFAKWSGLSCFSENGTTFSTIGGLFINCYDENTHANLTFNVKVSNPNGSQVYENTGCTNTHIINESLCPQGDDIQIIVSATGYQQRLYTLDIYTGMLYLLNTYLPPVTPPGGGTTDCNLRPYIDSITVTNPAVDATISLTYDLEDIITVEIYNISLYGTYGGWFFVPSNKYTYNTTSVTVDNSVLDANTTMARVNYYYMFCTGDVESALYNIRVIESIATEYTTIDQAVEDAFVEVKRYINTSGMYITVTSLFTDANGYINVYLVPNVDYKVFINKSGYYNVVGSSYIPMPPNEWGQTTEKIFRITRIPVIPVVPTVYLFWDNITYTATMQTNNTIQIIYDDTLLGTVDSQIYIYEYYNGTLSLINSTSYGVVNSYSYYVSGVNTSRLHYADLYLNHTMNFSEGFNLQPVRIILYPITYNITSTPFDLEARIVAIVGPGPLGPGSWCPFIICMVGLCVLGSFGPFHVGVAIILSGFSMGLLSVIFAIWLTNPFPVAVTAVVGFSIAIGVGYIFTKQPSEGL